MKKTNRRLISLFLVLAMLASFATAFAADEPTIVASGEYYNIKWTLDEEGTLMLIGSGEIGSGISYGWTKYSSNITSIILDDRITSIGDRAFKACRAISAKLPAELTSIGKEAFAYCSALTLAELPAGVTSIGESAFKECRSLALKELPAGLTSIENNAFDGCTSLALTELPDGITSIGDNAFYGCLSLALTELPAGVTSIGVRAFYSCISLVLEKLPSGLTSIERAAFGECTSLALTELPDGITSIGDNAFYGCLSLALAELPHGITSIENNTFEGCTSLALTKLPDGVTSIGASAFSGCTSLALIELPAGVTSVGGMAFRECTSLALTELPAGLTWVIQYAFLNATWCVKTEHYVRNKSGGFELVDTTTQLVKTEEIATADIVDYSEIGLVPTSHKSECITKKLPSGYISHGNAVVLRRYYDYGNISVTINDGEGGSTTQEVPYGGKATEPELEPRPGYTLSWETEDGKPFDFDDPITEPVTVSPVWTLKEGTIQGEVVDQDNRPVAYAHVSIVAGNTNYLETDADANGIFLVEGVPYGSYNAVATKRSITATSLLELDSAVKKCKVILPDVQTNSVLEVNQGTKDVVVGGLDALFNSELYDDNDQAIIDEGGAVTVKMTVKAVTEEEIPDTSAELKAAAHADGKTIFGYMTMDVSKITETAAGETTEKNIPELPQLIQIIDPLSEEQKGKTGYTVYRMHEGHVYTINETPNENGAYIKVTDDTLTIFASKFSDYCLGFDAPKVTPPSSGSSSSNDDDDGDRDPFIDVKPGDWFYKDVMDAYHAGYMEGITSNTFEPNSPLTRAQAAYTFAKVAKAQLKGLEITDDFEDVTKATTYAEAITWANDAGVEIGYGNGCFGPTDALTREQLALMLYRTYGNGQEVSTWDVDFADVADVSDWSETAVRWAVHVGLLEGNDRGELLPQGQITRAETAALILRAVKLPQRNGR